MKKTLLFVSAALALAFTGCADKAPQIDQTASSNAQTDSQSTSMNNAQIDMATLVSQLQNSLQSVYFGFDKFNINPQMQSVINDDAMKLNETNVKNVALKLEGNCDEWGSDEYNMALGLKRAQSVKTALEAQGVDASRISVVSLGKNNPTCSQKTKDCWAKNRRVDFLLK